MNRLGYQYVRLEIKFVHNYHAVFFFLRLINMHVKWIEFLKNIIVILFWYPGRRQLYKHKADYICQECRKHIGPQWNIKTLVWSAGKHSNRMLTSAFSNQCLRTNTPCWLSDEQIFPQADPVNTENENCTKAD